MLLKELGLLGKIRSPGHFAPEQKRRSMGNLASSVGFAGNIVAGTPSVMTALCWCSREARNARLPESIRRNRGICRWGVLVLRGGVYRNEGLEK